MINNNQSFSQNQSNGGVVVDNLTSFGSNFDKSPSKRNNMNEGSANEYLDELMPLRIKADNKFSENDHNKRMHFKHMK